MESLLLFVREFRPFWKCVWQALTANIKTLPSKNNSEGSIVILLPGWLNDEGNTLIGLQEFMDNRGRRCYILSVHYFKRWRKVMIDTARQILDIVDQQEGEKINIVGHSLGGAIALLILLTPLGERVHRVIILGTPILGSPIPIAKFLAWITTGISEDLFNKYFFGIAKRKKIVKEALAKVVCITSQVDGIAPPSTCEVPGMRLVDLSSVFPDRKISHIGMILDQNVWELIDRELI